MSTKCSENSITESVLSQITFTYLYLHFFLACGQKLDDIMVRVAILGSGLLGTKIAGEWWWYDNEWVEEN